MPGALNLEEDQQFVLENTLTSPYIPFDANLMRHVSCLYCDYIPNSACLAIHVSFLFIIIILYVQNQSLFFLLLSMFDVYS